MEQNTDIKKIIAVAVIFFVIGFGVSWLIFGRGSGTAQRGEEIAEEKEMEGAGEAKERENMTSEEKKSEQAALFSTVGGGSGIAADDQDAGVRARIAKVVLTGKAWIAIYEDKGGAPGKILGAQRFPAGERSGAVDLLRATAPGSVYYAVIHQDDGDAIFDSVKDAPARDAAGNYIMARFSTHSAAPGVQ